MSNQFLSRLNVNDTMSSVLVSGLIALAAAASAKSSSKKKNAEPVQQLPPVPDPSSLVYIPEASMAKHPGNLPTHVPVLSNPETDPETANTYNWKSDAWNQNMKDQTAACLRRTGYWCGK